MDAKEWTEAVMVQRGYQEGIAAARKEQADKRKADAAQQRLIQKATQR